ncbi:C6 zinc finger domain protein [Diplocarpon rosae]|nr:C6 zinc finger domain protein [Diplocarpon rosae]
MRLGPPSVRHNATCTCGLQHEAKTNASLQDLWDSVTTRVCHLQTAESQVWRGEALLQEIDAMPKPAPSRPLDPVQDPMERTLLHFFSTYSAPILSGYFSTDFWERRVVQSSHGESTIRHAVIAIAAMHQEFNERRRDFGMEDTTRLQTFAFRQYTKAISSLHYLMTTKMPPLDLTLTSCILFASIDGLLGNHASAIIHLKAGLRILADIKTHRTEKGISADAWEQEFTPPLLALGVQTATFINPALQKERASLWAALRRVGRLPPPAEFHSLDTARRAIDTISATVMADRTSTELQPRLLENRPPDPLIQGRLYNEALNSWTLAMDKFIADYATGEPPTSKTICGASLLKVHSLVVSIVIGKPEEADAKFDHLITLCDFLESARISSGAGLTFATDQRVIAPLFFTALRAPDKTTKRRAIELLARAPAREGMWDAEDAIRVADGSHSDIQNVGGFVLNAILPAVIPEEEIKIWNDIASRLKSRMSWPFGESGLVQSPAPTTSPQSESSYTSGISFRQDYTSPPGVPNQ